MIKINIIKNDKQTKEMKELLTHSYFALKLLMHDKKTLEEENEQLKADVEFFELRAMELEHELSQTNQKLRPKQNFREEN